MVSRAEIQAYADKIGERFHPEKIILFEAAIRGSTAILLIYSWILTQWNVWELN